MKKILLLSDTHNRLDSFVVQHLQTADEIWHAGDIGSYDTYKFLCNHGKLVRAVYGNIDGYDIRSHLPKILIFRTEGKKIMMTHIGGYPGKYPDALLAMLKITKPDVFICGHSHLLKIIYDKSLDLLHLNPGAVGLEGFHKLRTMLRFKLDVNRGIYDMDILEKIKAP